LGFPQAANAAHARPAAPAARDTQFQPQLRQPAALQLRRAAAAPLAGAAWVAALAGAEIKCRRLPFVARREARVAFLSLVVKRALR